MNDPSIRGIDNTFTLLGQALAAPPRTGNCTATAAKDLQEGWVSLAHFHKLGSDDTTDYTGPVIAETAKTITIEVHGDKLSFLKESCDITRPLAAS